MVDEAEHRARQLTALLEVSRAVASSLDLSEVLGTILDQLGTIVAHTGSSVMILEGSDLVFLDQRSIAGHRTHVGARLPVDAAPALWGAVAKGETVLIDDVRSDEPMAVHYRSIVTAGGVSDMPPLQVLRSWMGVPLVVKDEAIGLLTISHVEPAHFSAADARLARAFADQAALAIENARLFEQARSRTRELAALLEVSHAVASTLETRTVMALILDQLHSIIDHTGSAIMTIVGDELEIVDVRAIPGAEREIGVRLPLSGPLTGLWSAILRGEAVIIDDMRSDEPMALDYRGIVSAAGLWELPPFQVLRSWMGVPLALKDQVIGMLAVSQRVPAYFTPEHARIARAFADHAAIAIQNARLFDEREKRARELAALLEVSAAVGSTLDLGDLMGVILDQVGTIMPRTGSSILIHVDSTLEFVGMRPTTGSERMLGARLPLDPNMGLWQALSRGEAVIVRDVHSDELMAVDLRSVMEAAGLLDFPPFQALRSWLAVPLMQKDRVIGVLTLSRSEPAFFTQAHARLARAFADQAAVAIENARLFEQAQLGAALEERQRLARELHDSVSQALYGIALGARTARTLLDREPAAAVEPVDYVLSLAEVGLTEMRSLIFELRPETLETEGLIAALRKQVEAVQARHGIKVDFQPGEEPGLPLPHKEAVYRIAQESLHNVVKHSRATRVSVTLTSTPSGATLEVEDNGAGFDPAGDFPGHLGLRSMTERADKAGGRLEIASRPGSGTRVIATFPTR